MTLLIRGRASMGCMAASPGIVASIASISALATAILASWSTKSCSRGAG